MAADRILVIERNAKIGELVTGQLREKGFEADDVRHGAEAALKLRDHPTKIILMDNQIAMGGIKTARILRLHKKYNTIPIILGLPTDKSEARSVIEDAQQVGLKNFLLKPYTMNQLQAKIEGVLNDPEAVEEPTELSIREEIRSLTNLPAMPAAHSKLLQLLGKADEEVDLNQVSTTLEQDPALSAKVMKTCRSAYFGFQGSLMKQAVAFLGVSVIRKIVQSAVISDMFAEEKADAEHNMTMNDLWRHSLATGCAMEVIGKEDKKKTHFILGVMHDIGKAVFKFRFGEHFAKVLEMVAAENCSILKAEEEVLGITHADCGAELAVHWDLPAEVRTAIADIAVRTMKIGFAGDDLIPEMDPYAKRLQKSVDEITSKRDDIQSQVNSILGGGDDEAEE